MQALVNHATARLRGRQAPRDGAGPWRAAGWLRPMLGVMLAGLLWSGAWAEDHDAVQLQDGAVCTDGQGDACAAPSYPANHAAVAPDACDQFCLAGKLAGYVIARTMIVALTAACETMDVANACALLGDMYEDGVSLAADPERAAALYRQGCD